MKKVEYTDPFDNDKDYPPFLHKEWLETAIKALTREITKVSAERPYPLQRLEELRNTMEQLKRELDAIRNIWESD